MRILGRDIRIVDEHGCIQFDQEYAWANCNTGQEFLFQVSDGRSQPLIYITLFRIKMKHGRARMPWGKFKGTRIRLLPNDYISWLTTSAIMKDDKWWFLKESLMAELRFRGLRADLADTEDPAPVEIPDQPKPDLPLRMIDFEE